MDFQKAARAGRKKEKDARHEWHSIKGSVRF
jgi:hypothetical protein